MAEVPKKKLARIKAKKIDRRTYFADVAKRQVTFVDHKVEAAKAREEEIRATEKEELLDEVERARAESNRKFKSLPTKGWVTRDDFNDLVDKVREHDERIVIHNDRLNSLEGAPERTFWQKLKDVLFHRF